MMSAAPVFDAYLADLPAACGGTLGVWLPSEAGVDTIVDYARQAEASGFASAWMIENPSARNTPLVLALAARSTETILLGTGILPIFGRHPVSMIQLATTLDELSSGRFVLGLGTSHRNTVEDMLGLSLAQPVAVMREYLTVVRQGLEQRRVSFAGDHFSVEWQSVHPWQPHSRVLIAALRPKMLELAGELADGVVLWLASPRYIEEVVVPGLARGCDRAGRRLEDLEIVACVPTTRHHGALADQALERFLVPYAGQPFYQEVLARGCAPAGASRQPSLREIERELAAVGGPDEVAAVVERYRGAGCTTPALLAIDGTLEEDV